MVGRVQVQCQVRQYQRGTARSSDQEQMKSGGREDEEGQLLGYARPHDHFYF